MRSLYWSGGVVAAAMMTSFAAPVGVVIVISALLLTGAVVIVARHVVRRVANKIAVPEFILIALIAVVGMVGMYTHFYWAVLVLSASPGEHFRISEGSRARQSVERLVARPYLRTKIAEYEKLFKDDRTASEALADKDLTFAVRTDVWTWLGPTTSEPSETPEPWAVATLVHALATESQRLTEYSRAAGGAPGSYMVGIVDGVVERRSAGFWTRDPIPHERGEKIANAVMLTMLREILRLIGKEGDVAERRELYLVCLLANGLLFMTAGSGDLAPNSVLAAAMVLSQFVVYIIGFLILLPLSINALDGARGKETS